MLASGTVETPAFRPEPYRHPLPLLSSFAKWHGPAPLSLVSLFTSLYRGDEKYAYAFVAALFALTANAPAFVPLFALPPAARTRRPTAPGSQPVKILFDTANLTLFLQFFNILTGHYFKAAQNPKKFRPPAAGSGASRTPRSLPLLGLSIFQNFNVLSFRALPGSPAPAPCFVLFRLARFRFALRAVFVIPQFRDRPRKSRGATRSTHTQT